VADFIGRSRTLRSTRFRRVGIVAVVFVWRTRPRFRRQLLPLTYACVPKRCRVGGILVFNSQAFFDVVPEVTRCAQDCWSALLAMDATLVVFLVLVVCGLGDFLFQRCGCVLV
jgi:hypothetical protein